MKASPKASPTCTGYPPAPFAAPLVAALVAFLVALFPLPSYSFQIHGRVVNGTTDQPVTDATITVVNPSGGMLVEKEVKVRDAAGNFVVENLDGSNPVYLLRVSYEGVNYTEMVQFDGRDPYTLEISVYEPMTSWENVHVSVPHFIVMRSQDTLSVNKFYEITNHSSPPRTLTSPFPFYVPQDRISLNSCTVMSLGIPLSRTPAPTDEAGFYSVAYPFKPGGTQLSVSMDLPYHGETYTYNEPLKYDIDELVILVSDPTLQVTRGGQPVERTEDMRGFASYRMAGLESGSTLSLTFTGGSAVAGGFTGDSGGGGGVPAGHGIIIVPNETQGVSIALMVVLGFVLVGLLAFIAGRPKSAEMEQEALLAHREILLDQLARLDDLNQTLALSEKMYQIKRTELVNDLAQVYYRAKFDGGPQTKKKKKRKGVARV
ncbi:MAG: carboxypeptidase-like regulatory domain-containing protein [Candidatus Krumholzibacteria bacterium]